MLGSRRGIVVQQTADKNALTALLRGCDLGIDARKALTPRQYVEIAKWETRAGDDQEQAIARFEAKRLAANVLNAGSLLEQNGTQLGGLVRTLAPGLLEIKGVGSVTAAQVLCSYSHKGRLQPSPHLLERHLSRPPPAM